MPTVTAHGRTEEIPDIWLAGFCTGNNCSVQDAIAYWVWQSDLREQDEKEDL